MTRPGHSVALISSITKGSTVTKYTLLPFLTVQLRNTIIKCLFLLAGSNYDNDNKDNINDNDDNNNNDNNEN